jgi:hypothetical protein
MTQSASRHRALSIFVGVLFLIVFIFVGLSAIREECSMHPDVGANGQQMTWFQENGVICG